MLPNKAIAAGTTSEVTKELFRWYIPMYYGFKYADSETYPIIDTPENIRADQVKSLTAISGNTAYNATVPTKITASGSWRQLFIAIPATYGVDLKEIRDSNNLLSPFSKKVVAVPLTFGPTDNSITINYNIWYVNYEANYDTTEINLIW